MPKTDHIPSPASENPDGPAADRSITANSHPDPAQRPPSIARNLTLSLVITVMAVAGIAIGINYINEIRQARRDIEARADEYIELLVGSIQVPLWNLEYETVNHIAEFFAKNVNLNDLRIVGDNGTVYYDIDQEREGPFIRRSATIRHEGVPVGTVQMGLVARLPENVSGSILQGSFLTLSVVLFTLIAATGVLLRIFLKGPLDQLGAIVHAYDIQRATPGVVDRANLAAEFEPFVDLLERMRDQIRSQMAALRQAEAKYRTIFENAVEGIFQTTPEGRLLTANPALASMLGYDTPEAVVASVDNIATQCYAQAECRDDMLAIIQREGRVVGYETELIRKDGTVFWAAINARAIRDETGRISCYEGTIIDISERRRLEELERAEATADAENRAKSEFLANISHEIRTPMNAVLGLTGLLGKTELTAKQRDYTGKIGASARMLLGVINDILDYSKIEAGQLVLESTELRINQIMERLSDGFSEKSAAKHIELVVSVARGVPDRLMGDPYRLEQILANLTDNAVKFTDRGEVLVHVEAVGGDDKTTALAFTVKDTGIGMSPEMLRRMFRVDRRGGAEGEGPGTGTGLGLMICRRLVRMMGGELRADSTPDGGTTFRFTLRFQRHPDAAVDDMQLPRGLSGLKVLVVDDNESARNTIEEMLRSFGFKTAAVETGEQALEHLLQKRKPTDLMITDWRMPGLDGVEICKRLRREPDFAELPLIILTEMGNEEVMHRAEAAGVNACLIKPVKQSILFDTIIELFVDRVRAAYKTAIDAEAAADSRLDGGRVLLVEDNLINQEVSQELLTGMGLEVAVVGDGQAAVDAIREDPSRYNAVLMDIQMPNLDGLAATRQIREDDRCTRLPIIAMTAHALDGDREACFEAGMDDYISKPIDPDELRAVLLRWIAPPPVEADAADPGDETDSPRDISEQLNKAGYRLKAVGRGDEQKIDTETGLQRVGGNHQLYARLLREFWGAYGDAADQIQELLRRGDRDRARELIQRLKSVAGNISAGDVHAAAEALEHEFRRPDDQGGIFPNSSITEVLISGLREAVDRAVSEVRGMRQVNPVEAGAEFRAEPIDTVLLARLNEMHTLLLTENPLAVNHLPSLHRLLNRPSERQRIRQISEHLGRLDYQSARNTLAVLAWGLGVCLTGEKAG